MDVTQVLSMNQGGGIPLARSVHRDAEAVRKAAEDLVSVALVQPILAQLRDTNQAAGPFAPGQGEKLFGPLLDAAWSSQIVKGQNFNVVDAVAERISDPGRELRAWAAARREQVMGGR